MINFIQVMGFLIFLMDGKESSVLKMDQKKRISLSKIDKMFKVINFELLLKSSLWRSLLVVNSLSPLQLEVQKWLNLQVYYNNSNWHDNLTETLNFIAENELHFGL